MLSFHFSLSRVHLGERSGFLLFRKHSLRNDTRRFKRCPPVDKFFHFLLLESRRFIVADLSVFLDRVNTVILNRLVTASFGCLFFLHFRLILVERVPLHDLESYLRFQVLHLVYHFYLSFNSFPDLLQSFLHFLDDLHFLHYFPLLTLLRTLRGT